MHLYFDEMMPRQAANELVKRGVTVTMAVDVGMTSKPDPEQLQYATGIGAVMVTLDQPFSR
jgi:predicted nuclease of predicted toxin-antitoxin system